MPREAAVPAAIAAGADMFLFTIDLAEDVAFMRRGVADGRISRERLDDAVTRILALKAALELPRKRRDGALIPPEAAMTVLGCGEHRAWAAECADKSLTLVKDTQAMLPLTPQRYRRLLVYVLGDNGGYLDLDKGAASALFVKALAEAGFEVDAQRHSAADEGMEPARPASSFKARYDAIVYFANLKTASNQTMVRLSWAPPMGTNCPRHVSELPTVFVSVGNPYHLQDVPQIKTFINGYTGADEVVRALIDKLMGKSPFTGVSPVDPFCGYWDAHL
jgi:beta-N-acetylhexosaminidase